MTLSDYWLFADLKKMLLGKIFGSNEPKLEAYFESKDEPKCTERLKKRLNEYITLERNYVDE